MATDDYELANTCSSVIALHGWPQTGWDWNMGKNIGRVGPARCCTCGSLRGAGTCHIAMVIKCTSLCTLNSSLHMSETSDSSGSGSFKASFVTVTKLAFERVSMAECIMGSHTSSMFGITNIF